MSSDFLDLDDDVNGFTVVFSMKASGDAFLTVLGNENTEYYHFSPTETGWQSAEKIIGAIRAWIEYTRENYTKENCKEKG